MSHEFESGFVVGQQAWHGLSTVLKNAPSISDALRLAGLDWKVEAVPVFAEIQEPVVGADGEVAMQKVQTCIESHRCIVRSTDKSILGVVSKDYVPLQNEDALEVFRPLVEDGSLRLETAGSLQNGRKVWVQARYANDEAVQGSDVVVPFLLIAAGHDGKMSVSVTNTPTRVVCWNTMQAAGAVEDAKAKGRDSMLRVQHKGAVRAKVEAARDLIVHMRDQYMETMRIYRAMATKPISEQQVRELARTVFDRDLMKANKTIEKLRHAQAERAEFLAPPVREAIAKQIEELEAMLGGWQASRAEQGIVDAFRNSPGSEWAGETAWGALNAVTYYIDHGKRGAQSSRMASSWFGPAAAQRKQAFELLAATV